MGTSALLVWAHVAVAIVPAVAASAAHPAPEPVWPGKTWARKTPAEVGLEAGPLKALAKYAGGRGCVVRRGCMVYTWGDAAKRGDVASAAKPWYSHFLLLAQQKGKIKDLDEKILRYQPGLKGLNEGLGYKDRRITWRHLAYQTSCYGLKEKPGTAFAYNDWSMALFWDTLFVKVYGVRYETVDEKVLHPMLTQPLQCQDTPTFMAFGTRNRPGRLAVSPRDFARFGLLYLRGGKWKDRQLLDAKLARLAVASPLPNSIPRAGKKAAEMMPRQRSVGSRSIPDNQCDHIGSYSYLWWTNGIDRKGKRHWPDVPTDTYGAFGHGGLRAMVVLPSLDLIISWNNTRIRGRQKENHALGLLVQSVQDVSARDSRPPLAPPRGSEGKQRSRISPLPRPRAEDKTKLRMLSPELWCPRNSVSPELPGTQAVAVGDESS